MSDLFDRSLCGEPKIELLHKDKATKSIVVSKIPFETLDTDVYGDIIIHFQRRKNGGGEIENVFVPKKGTAVVTFEDRTVVEKVLKQCHTFRGEELKVQRLVSEHSPMIFQNVEGRVSLDKFHLSSQEVQNVPRILKDKANVRAQDSITGECVLVGTFDQIKAAGDVLQDFLKNEDEITRKGDTAQSKHSSTEVFEGEDYSSINTISSFDVQPQFMKLLEQLYQAELQEIKERHGVRIVWNCKSTKVQIYPTTAEDTGSYQKGSDAFISLYQAFYPKVCRKVIELKFPYHKEVITENDISSMEAANNVAIEMEENKLVVYAEESDISDAVEALKETLELSIGNSENPRNNERNLNQNKISQRRRSSTEALSQILENSLTLSLYQGDITEETAHAIVNAANEWLSHGGGVAAAIERKGGRQIKEESRQIISQRNGHPLNVGDAVYTKAGTLPCKFVIHTVGPRWDIFDRGECVALLHRACTESLNLAKQLRLRSIALPPISSGIFGMPKDICAQAMFGAVEEFSSSVQAGFNTLCDVRIVIIDDETISVFHEEFLKRYTSLVTTQTNQARDDGDADSSSKVSPKVFKPPLSSERREDSFRGHSKADEGVKLPQKVQSGMGNSSLLEHVSTAIESSAEDVQSKLLTQTEGESSNVESRADSEKGSNAAPTTKTSRDTSKKPSFGRGRGVLAASFTKVHGKGEELKSKADTRLIPGHEIVRTGRGITYDSNTLPPGPTTTEEVKRLAQPYLSEPYEPVSEALSKDTKTEAPADKSSNQMSPTEEQEPTLPNQEEKVKIKEESPNGRLNPNQKEGSASKIIFDDSIPDPHENGNSSNEKSLTRSERPGEDESTDSYKPKDDQHDTEMEEEVDQSFNDAGLCDIASRQDAMKSDQSSNISDTQGVQERPDIENIYNQAAGRQPNIGEVPPRGMNQHCRTGDRDCSMCTNQHKDLVYGLPCGHYYCKSCISCYLTKLDACPKCRQEKQFRGNQPIGYMDRRNESRKSLPGYEKCGTIVITFNFPAGIQVSEHPNPGERYEEIVFTAYLPDNPGGREVCSLLRKAFDERLLFTIRKDSVNGRNRIVLNGIELKTARTGGPTEYGYPDPSYFDRLIKQLADKGITPLREETFI